MNIELNRLIQSMGALLMLNTQVSMDGSIERKKDKILSDQGGITKAVNELIALEKEIYDLKKQLTKEAK